MIFFFFLFLYLPCITSFFPLLSPSPDIFSYLHILIPLHYTHSLTHLLTFSILSSLHSTIIPPSLPSPFASPSFSVSLSLTLHFPAPSLRLPLAHLPSQDTIRGHNKPYYISHLIQTPAKIPSGGVCRGSLTRRGGGRSRRARQ